jgi:hypothetical protein
MKTTILALLVLSPFCFGAQPDPAQVEWRPAPDFNEADRNWVILPQTDIYEVGISQMSGRLIRDFPACGFKELTEAEAQRVTGHHFASAAGKRPFLIRAVYAREGIGAFRVERKGNSLEGNSLAVIWGSYPGLSHQDIGQSALVVNLDSTPIEIYNQSSTIPF